MTDEERKLVLSVFPEIEEIIFKLAEKLCEKRGFTAEARIPLNQPITIHMKANPDDLEKVEQVFQQNGKTTKTKIENDLFSLPTKRGKYKTFRRSFFVKFSGEDFREYENVAHFMKYISGKRTENTNSLAGEHNKSETHEQRCADLKNALCDYLKTIKCVKKIDRIARITLDGMRIEA